MFFKSIVYFLYSYKKWLIVLFVAFILLTTNRAYSELNGPIVQGYLDSSIVEGEKLVFQGWFGSVKPANNIVTITISLGDKIICDGRFERFERPDVVEATGRADWLKSGWRVKVDMPNLKRGVYPVKVLARLDNGQSSPIFGSNSGVEKIFISGSEAQSSKIWMFWIIMISMIIMILMSYLKADYASDIIMKKTCYFVKPSVFFGSVLLLVFIILIVLGVTGSSFRLGLNQTPFVDADITKVLGNGQDIRSDEWLVFTPLAIAQYNHEPKFPIVNNNIGEDGQNMLLIGNAGAPVAHVSALAKPATWGFFMFDLKRALSWYWCFPIFGCLFALWGVVALILPGDWRSSFLISLMFCLSPYIAAWSNWPAYSVLFPSLSLNAAVSILNTSCKYRLVLFSCVLGVSLAGFVLVLYPPFQISLGYVFVALMCGIVIRDKFYFNFNKIKLLYYAFSMIVAALVLWAWWVDARFAIQTMLSTVYPGQRNLVVGGSVSLSELLRGFTNIVTMNKLDSPYSNKSEIGSFLYVFIPLLLLFFLRVFQKSINAVEISIFVIMMFILYFMLIGIPPAFAQLSLWGRVPPTRADLALGLSSIILSGVLIKKKSKPIPKTLLYKMLAFAFASLWAALVINRILFLNSTIVSSIPPSFIVLLFFFIIASGYWLATGRFKNFVGINLVLTSSIVIPFNPISIAPHKVNVTIPFVDESNPRILVLETQVSAMLLLASGHHVVNGVFYYPQKSLWERLDKDSSQINTYNRYQHLIFTGGAVDNTEKSRIESPQADVVRVVVNLEAFDFNKAGADLLVAPTHDMDSLKKNKTLTHVYERDGWSWFNVKKAKDAS
jgi:hypothetical protein